MGFSDMIKRLFRRKEINTQTIEQEETRLVGYDTSLVFVPEYKELSEVEKRKVEEYKKEIANIQETEKLINYSTELIETGNRNQKILIKLLYQTTSLPLEWQLEEMTMENLVKSRFEILIKQEEMQKARAELEELKKEAILRTVAVEEKIKEENSIKRVFFSVFQKAEQMKRKMELQVLDNTKERMKITIKTLEQMAQAVDNAMKNDNILVESFEIYQKVLEKLQKNENQRFWKERKEVIESALYTQASMCEIIFPEEYEKIINLANQLEEKEVITEEEELELITKIAENKRKLDIFAMQNQDKIPELKEMLKAVRAEFEKFRKETPINDVMDDSFKQKKNQLQECFDKIESSYKVFQDYITEKEWEELYEVEFDILTYKMDEDAKFAFSHYKVSDLSIYIKIIEKRLEKLFQKESMYPNLYGKFIQQLKRALKNINPDKDMAWNAFKTSGILEFLQDIENPNFLQKGESIPPLSIKNFVGDLDIHFSFDGKNYMKIQEYMELVQFLSLNQSHWILEDAIKDIKYLLNRETLEVQWRLSGWLQMLYGAMTMELPRKKELGVFLLPKGINVIQTPDVNQDKNQKTREIYTVGMKTAYKIITRNKDLNSIENLFNLYRPSLLQEIEAPGICIKKTGAKALSIMKNAKYEESITYTVIIKPNFNGCYMPSEKISHVIFEEGVEKIPSYFFERCQETISISLPSTIKRINELAFYSAKVLELDLPEGIETIEAKAFSESHLKKIKLPTTLKIIGDDAFSDSHHLEEINLPEGIMEIGYAVFQNCNQLRKINLPETLERIGPEAFEGTAIKQIKLPHNLKKILGDTFRCCKKLEHIELPKELEEIGKEAFVSCPNLRSIELPESLKVIGEAAFNDSGIEEIKIPKLITSIPEYTFTYCKNLKKVEFPENLKHIGHHAFMGCNSLRKIELPEGLETLGEAVFLEAAVSSISLPSTLKEIPMYAFNSCTELRKIIIPKGVKKIGLEGFKYCFSLEEVILNEGLQRIEDNAFSGCESLKKIDLPKGLKEIGKESFYGCHAVKEISIPDTLEKIGESAFGASYAHIERLTIKGTKMEYKIFERIMEEVNSIKKLELVVEIPSNNPKECQTISLSVPYKAPMEIWQDMKRALNEFEREKKNNKTEKEIE